MTTVNDDRQDVWFGAPGERCAAWLYLPESPSPAPCVVLAHGFGATRDAGLAEYARRFAAAGWAALVFDYRGFGASEGTPRQVLDIGAQLRDWAAAIAYVRGHRAIDGRTVVLWGTSFSGGHVLTTAARDHRIAGVIAQVPYLGLVRRRRLPQPRVLTLAAKGVLDRIRRSRPLTVPLLGEPGSAALLQAPGALARFESLLPENSLWRNAVAARIVLGLPRYRPGTVAAHVRCPVLFCACLRDTVTPPDLIAAAATAAPQGELVEYDAEHFVVYDSPLLDRSVADQLAFLSRLPLPPATSPDE
jgi:cephalosporin-C deacetylase-like acetyl esterase